MCIYESAIVNTYDDDIFNYRYFYVSPTGDYTSSSGVYGNQYGVYGGTTKSTSIEVTIQFISAATQKPICSSTAEGQGETEADDVRKAIQRAFEPLFKSNNKK